MFRSTFAADVSTKKAALMAAEQRPLAAAAGGEPTTATAWKTIPSWTLIGLEDKAIPAAQQLFMAKRAGSTIVQIQSSHVAMISHPNSVTKLIESAARAGLISWGHC
jgi:pimeloyl-ACP methyl ester carboxylesterase